MEEEEEVESIMLDPTHEWWNIWALFRRVFRSHRFKVPMYIEPKENFMTWVLILANVKTLFLSQTVLYI